MSQKILLVEDYDVVAGLLETLLSMEGYEVTIASDGCTGLELARSGIFDLIVLDLMMPGLDGIRILEKLKGEGASIPVIVLSGSATDDITQRVLSAGAYAALRKPVDHDELLDRVRRALSINKKSRRA